MTRIIMLLLLWPITGGHQVSSFIVTYPWAQSFFKNWTLLKNWKHCFHFHNFPHNFPQHLCFPVWVWHISPGHLTLTHSQLWHSSPGNRHRSIAPKEILSANFIIRSGVYLGSKALLGPCGESDEVWEGCEVWQGETRSRQVPHLPFSPRPLGFCHPPSHLCPTLLDHEPCLWAERLYWIWHLGRWLCMSPKGRVQQKKWWLSDNFPRDKYPLDKFFSSLTIQVSPPSSSQRTTSRTDIVLKQWEKEHIYSKW